MPRFGTRSRERLETCDERLIVLLEVIVVHYDCTIICGHRGEDSQNQAFRDGFSHKRWPDSKHNRLPSIAVDVAPWFETEPHIRWNDGDSFRVFGGFVMGVASQIGTRLRWGHDWDGDWDLDDQTFYDAPHFELLSP